MEQKDSKKIAVNNRIWRNDSEVGNLKFNEGTQAQKSADDWASVKLMNEMTQSLSESQNEFFTELTSMVWAEGQTVEASLSALNPQIKFGLTADEVNQVVNVLMQVGKVHDAESEGLTCDNLGKFVTANDRIFFIDRTGHATQQCTSKENVFCIGETKCNFCNREIQTNGVKA